MKKLTARLQLLRPDDDPDGSDTALDGSLRDENTGPCLNPILSRLRSARTAVPGSPIMDTAFRGIAKK